MRAAAAPAAAPAAGAGTASGAGVGGRACAIGALREIDIVNKIVVGQPIVPTIIGPMPTVMAIIDTKVSINCSVRQSSCRKLNPEK